MSKENKRHRSADNHLTKKELQDKIGETSGHYEALVQNLKTEMTYELQVQQIELEMQNRQLKQSQQELEESRDRYADLYDFSPVGYLTLQENGIIQDINLTGAVLLGAEREYIVGKHFINYLAPSAKSPFITYLRNTFLLSGNSFTEVALRQKEGKPRIVNLESKVVFGTSRTCRTVMSDVTEQRNMGVALQVIRSAQDALLSAIPAMVFYQDSNLLFTNLSQVFADFVGCSAEYVTGKSFHDLLPEAVADDFHRISTSVLETGMALYGYEHSMPDENGNLICFSTVISPFRDPKGDVIGLVGVCVDITHIKSTANLNSMLLVQNRVLTRNLFSAHEEERRHLARELHDELGQWLTAIQAEAQAICNVTNNHEPRIHESSLAISNSAKAVHKVIRNMLRKLRPSLLDELGLADSLRELHTQWCKSHPDIHCEINLDLSLENLGEEINVTIYRLLQESLTNIASHAGAHNIVVSFSREVEKFSGREYVLLKVEDDGQGFDSKNTRAGIGLLGMRERVIATGGDFYIDSEPGSGTKLTARLPVPDYGGEKLEH